jgi:uncharacterized protein
MSYGPKKHGKIPRVGYLWHAGSAKEESGAASLMLAGKPGIVSGWRNKLEAAAAHVIPATALAKRHTKMAAPTPKRTAKK